MGAAVTRTHRPDAPRMRRSIDNKTMWAFALVRWARQQEVGCGPCDVGAEPEVLVIRRAATRMDQANNLELGCHGRSREAVKAENPLSLAMTDSARVPGMRRVVDRSASHRTTVLSLLGLDLVAVRGVFSPQFCPGSAVLAGMLAPLVTPGARVLEMGSGIGLASIVAATRGASVVAVDLNPVAVVNTRINALLHQVEQLVAVHEGDLFDPLGPDDRFDIVYWNVPWGNVPESEVRSVIDSAVFDPGYCSLGRFLGEVGSRLTDVGRVFVGFSDTFGDSTAVARLARLHGFRSEVHDEVTLFDEGLDDTPDEGLWTSYQLHALTPNDRKRR